MRRRPTALLLGALLAVTALSGCVPAAPATTGSDAPVETPIAADPAETATDADTLEDFPAHFPLPEWDPTDVERNNYAWTIEYAVADEDVTTATLYAESFSDVGYAPVEVGEEFTAAAGPEASTWAWEIPEFHVEIALIPGDPSTLRLLVTWR